jgi:hypothetical protein
LTVANSLQSEEMQPIVNEAERVEVVSPHDIIERMLVTQRRLQEVDAKLLRVKAWVQEKVQQRLREIEQIQSSAQEILDLLNDSSSQISPEQRIKAEDRLKEIVADIFSIFEQIFPLSPIELFCPVIEGANYRQVKTFLDKNLNQLDEQRLHIVKEKISKEERKIREIEQQINEACLNAQKLLDFLNDPSFQLSLEERTKAMDIVTEKIADIFRIFEQNFPQFSVELFCLVIEIANYPQVKLFLDKNLNQLDEQQLNIVKEKLSKEEQWNIREIEKIKQIKQMEIERQMKQMEMEQQRMEIEQKMKMKQMEVEQQMNEMCLNAQTTLDLLRDSSSQLSPEQRTEAMDGVTKTVDNIFSVFEQNCVQFSIESFCSVIKIANYSQVKLFLDKNLKQLDEQRLNIVKEKLSKEKLL